MDPIDEIFHRDPDALATSRALEARIRSEIAASGGRLGFDRFMELALYAPGLGYYVAGAAKLGPGGDFVTAPETSPLFGACIANQCADVFDSLGGGSILELGAGTGALALAVLERLDTLKALPEQYLILEPSPELAMRQRELIAGKLPEHAGRVRWLDSLPAGHRGIVLANEVIDAMPVHRFRVDDDGEPLEVFVEDRDGAFAEAAERVRSPGLAEAITEIRADGSELAPGYCSEVNLRLAPWLRALAQALERGLTLLVDYGYPRAAYYQADRAMGTLMCHLRHRAHADPYVHPGLQDITAHVDFTAAAEAGADAGFALAGFTTQAHFLIGCGIDALVSASAESNGGAPDLDLVLGAKQLLLPGAMGERFRVLGLSKGLDGPWCGFSARDLSDRL